MVFWQEFFYVAFTYVVIRLAVFIVDRALPSIYDYGWWMALCLLVVLYYRIRLPHLPWFTGWSLWQWYRNVWFPLSYVGYQEPPPLAGPQGAIHFYAMVPHGLCSCASFYGILMNPRLFGHVHCVVSSQLFWIPLIRNFAQICGAGEATKENMKQKLDEGRSLLLVPEGMRAFMHLEQRQEGMMEVLREHKGFCRVILSSTNAHRIHIVPVYTPHEWDTFRAIFPWPALQRKMIRLIWYAGPFVTLGWWGTWFPKRVPLDLHFGDPIPCTSPEGDLLSVDALHKTFCSAVEKMAKEIT